MNTNIKIDVFPLGPLETNAYLITDLSSRKAIVIDPGMDPEPLIRQIDDLDIEAILLTHAHFDHIGGVDVIRKMKNCPVYLHQAEADWLTDAEKNGSARWPELGGPIVTDPPDHHVQDGQVLHVLGLELTVLHTPGHSPGSVSYVYGDKVFGGDALFRMSVGRTDLPGGSSQELYDAIHAKLFPLADHTEVYPGHGPSTTIGFEKQHNPYV